MYDVRDINYTEEMYLLQCFSFFLQILPDCRNHNYTTHETCMKFHT